MSSYPSFPRRRESSETKHPGRGPGFVFKLGPGLRRHDEGVIGKRIVKPATILFAVATLTAAGGCSFSIGSNGKPQAEGIGTYQKQQARENDKDRATALRVRAAIAHDPILKSLGLHFFVNHGEVSLCGSFPNEKAQARALGVIGAVKGVEGVDTHCRP
jgi:hypothetical protein